jgi:hypothetical protein
MSSSGNKEEDNPVPLLCTQHREPVQCIKVAAYKHYHGYLALISLGHLRSKLPGATGCGQT